MAGLQTAVATRLTALPARREAPGRAAAGLAQALCAAAWAAAGGRGAFAAPTCGQHPECLGSLPFYAIRVAVRCSPHGYAFSFGDSRDGDHSRRDRARLEGEAESQTCRALPQRRRMRREEALDPKAPRLDRDRDDSEPTSPAHHEVARAPPELPASGAWPCLERSLSGPPSCLPFPRRARATPQLPKVSGGCPAGLSESTSLGSA